MRKTMLEILLFGQQTIIFLILFCALSGDDGGNGNDRGAAVEE